MEILDCHRMAISGYPMGGLYIVGKGNGIYAIYNFEKETETGHISSVS